MARRIFDAIGWVGIALVLVAVVVRFVRPEWNQYAQWGAWTGLACVLLYMASQWRDVLTFYQGRGARYGTLSIAGVLIFLGILVAVNYLGSRHNKRWDLTANQVFSLSDQTVRVLRELDAPVRFTVYDQETNFDRFRDRLRQYQYHSNRVSVEYVDVDRQPARARQADVQSYGTIVIEYGDRIERVTSTSEQDITNGLIKAITGEERTVYFTQGHGEKDPTSSDRTGYSAVAQALDRDNYRVERLVLAQQADVPEDASAIVVAGPRTDFLPPEVDALRRYVARGGKVLVLLDPPDPGESMPMPHLTGFLEEWGIRVGDDVVLDASGIGQLLGTDASVPVAASYPVHPITEGFNLMTAFPLARSVEPIEGGVEGRWASSIVQTSAQSWAETDLASLAKGEVAFDEGRDRRGPISLGAAVSAEATDVPAPADHAEGENDHDEADHAVRPQSRIAVIGDSDFAANFGIGIQGNRDFFMNTINWLAEQENLIAIRPRDPEDRRITLTADQQWRIMLLSIFVVPGLVFGAGVYSWWRRR